MLRGEIRTSMSGAYNAQHTARSTSIGYSSSVLAQTIETNVGEGSKKIWGGGDAANLHLSHEAPSSGGQRINLRHLEVFKERRNVGTRASRFYAFIRKMAAAAAMYQ